MTKPAKVLAIITARGGSKGLPRKNVVDFMGRPLISWTIEAAMESEIIDRTVVSTDDFDIAKVSKSYGAEVLIRPPEIATDTASSQSVILHALGELKEEIEDYEYFVLLQPTSPLRRSSEIDEAFQVLFNFSASGVISVRRESSEILKSFVLSDGVLAGVCNDDYPFLARQSLPDVYKANGAIFITLISDFLKKQSFLTGVTLPYIMSKERSVDIDTAEDLIIAEKIARQLKAKSLVI